MDVRNVKDGTESNMVAFDFVKTPITQIADYIIITASKMNTSDIHFDPRENGMVVRFRIDGDLQDYTFIPKSYERNLTTRLKLLANMNITESRLPQDGAIKGNFGDQYLDMRVSCLPLNEGEKIVIRILDYSRSLQGIDSLGFNKKNLAKLKRMMGVPNGIILVTGATGSGKSTTTYSILQGLNKPEINIITVEDPIEMNIEGMNQVQVNAEIGMTFAAALRSILRQDPNVILIGEIRDSETAQIAVRASITGHLVLSTIHTNNSLSTIERLLDMDVERYLLSTALTGIISQRLAKKLCTHCRFERETTPYEKKVFKKFMNKQVDKIWDANPKGCDHCRKGYKGRIAIQEVLELDDEIRNAINNENLEKEELTKMVYTDKTITMLQDALGKALEGETSFEEVYRVIEIETESGNDDSDYGAELTKAIKGVDIDSESSEESEENKQDQEKAEKKEHTEVVKTPTTQENSQRINAVTQNTENKTTTEQTRNTNPNQIIITPPRPASTTQDQPTTPTQPTEKKVAMQAKPTTSTAASSQIIITPPRPTSSVQGQPVTPTTTPTQAAEKKIVEQPKPATPTATPTQSAEKKIVEQPKPVTPATTPTQAAEKKVVVQPKPVTPTTTTQSVEKKIVEQPKPVTPTTTNQSVEKKVVEQPKPATPTATQAAEKKIVEQPKSTPSATTLNQTPKKEVIEKTNETSPIETLTQTQEKPKENSSEAIKTIQPQRTIPPIQINPNTNPTVRLQRPQIVTQTNRNNETNNISSIEQNKTPSI